MSTTPDADSTPVLDPFAADTAPYTLATLWFATDATPRAVMDAEPQPDRGFARKYLAQFNPRWPLTHIGDFDMARSAPPGSREFYIGAYPGLTVIQTVIPGLIRPSDIPPRLLTLGSAADVYATITVPTGSEGSRLLEADPLADDYSGLGGFAHWVGRDLKRSFSATRGRIYEDVGLPHPAESPFWEGTEEAHGIDLPFIPSELAAGVLAAWLGFDPGSGDVVVPVAAFATDGRPDASLRVPLPARPAPEQGLAPAYDDYAPSGGSLAPRESGQELARSLLAATGRGVWHGAQIGARGARSLARVIGDEVRRRVR